MHQPSLTFRSHTTRHTHYYWILLPFFPHDNTQESEKQNYQLSLNALIIKLLRWTLARLPLDGWFSIAWRYGSRPLCEHFFFPCALGWCGAKGQPSLKRFIEVEKMTRILVSGKCLGTDGVGPILQRVSVSGFARITASKTGMSPTHAAYLLYTN